MKFYSFWRSLAAYRVRIALNLKCVTPDEVIDVNLMKGQQREAAYRAVNPMMALPALLDGDGPILFESLAIIEYLDETHPKPPRVREYLEHELKIDEPTRMAWCRHWHTQALTALETHLKSKETGRFSHGDQVTIADICLASQAAGAKFFNVDTAPFPNVVRIAGACQEIDAFARAHPLKQPGAPASV
jgi:glutathione S-transferase